MHDTYPLTNSYKKKKRIIFAGNKIIITFVLPYKRLGPQLGCLGRMIMNHES